MNRVCCVIDLEGFQLIGRRFLVREFGFIGVNSPFADSIAFYLSPYQRVLCERDRKTIEYVTRNISGLPFHPSIGEETVPLSSLNSKVIAVYNLYRDRKRNLVAFKGGNIEKRLLMRLNIPYLDLEDYGCPKYNVLKEEKAFQSCGFHINENLHCPQAEVTAFRTWMLENITLK